MRLHLIRSLLCAAALSLPPLQSTPAARAAEPLLDNGAVVVIYHRFGESGQASTNVTLEQFDAHLTELASGRYSVLPLPEIVAALREGQELPDRAIAITIDDAYLSTYTEAWPRLRAAGLPFTLFVATDFVDRGLSGYMSWDQVRELAASDLVTIGSQTASHPHMVRLARERNQDEIARANARLEAEVGAPPTLFAYPYGEYSLAVRDLVEEAGFLAAFGQHSGAIARTMNLFALPRFPFNEAYGDIDRFRLVANSLPLPATELTPKDALIGPDSNPPLYGFTVAADLGRLSGLNCFAGGPSQARVERLGQRIEVRLARPLPPGRARINCTMPAPEGRWRWFGRQLYVPPRD